MGTKEDKSNEYSKNKIPIGGRPFIEHLADIVICFYLHNPYGKKINICIQLTLILYSTNLSKCYVLFKNNCHQSY